MYRHMYIAYVYGGFFFVLVCGALLQGILGDPGHGRPRPGRAIGICICIGLDSPLGAKGGSENPVRKVGLGSPLGAKGLRNSDKEGWIGQSFESQGAPKFR